MSSRPNDSRLPRGVSFESWMVALISMTIEVAVQAAVLQTVPSIMSGSLALTEGLQTLLRYRFHTKTGMWEGPHCWQLFKADARCVYLSPSSVFCCVAMFAVAETDYLR